MFIYMNERPTDEHRHIDELQNERHLQNETSMSLSCMNVFDIYRSATIKLNMLSKNWHCDADL